MNGNFIKLNPEWERTLEYLLAELGGKPFFDFIHPDDVDRTAIEAREQANLGELTGCYLKI